MKYTITLKNRIMKKLIRKLPEPIQYWLAITIFTTALACLYTWPWHTIVMLIVLGKVQQHWEDIKMFFIVSALALIPGIGIPYLIGYAYEWDKSTTALVALFSSIYALGLVIEQNNWKPYIWLWQQCKKLFKKRQHNMLIS